VTVEMGDDEPEHLDAAIRVVAGSFGDLGPSLRPTDRRTQPEKATVIAFVGSEATGKSTILSEVEGWLGRGHRVRRVHAGKPPSTPITFVPHVLLPALRAVFPEQRTLRVEERYEDANGTSGTSYPLLFGLRSVMLAYERRALLLRAIRSGGGTVVLSDRYPSDTSGAPDGPQLAHLPTPARRLSVRRMLARMEDRLYRDIPPPDLVFHLSAPLEVTLARNAARNKREPEDYVRFRHELSSRLRFDGTPVYRVDTDRDLGLVVQEIEGVIGDGRASAR
jgi:thymidylate kinase